MEKGMFLQVHYIGRISETHEIFDLTDETVAKKEGIYNEDQKYGPVTVIVGNNTLLPALDSALLGMKVGEGKNIKLQAKDAFGERKKELIKQYSSRVFIKNKISPTPRTVVQIGDKAGRVLMATSGRVRVDFNHPMAGKNVEYVLKIVSEVTNEKEKVHHLVSSYTGEAPFEIREKVLELTLNREVPEVISKLLEKDIKAYTGLEKLVIHMNNKATTE